MELGIVVKGWFETAEIKNRADVFVYYPLGLVALLTLL